MPEYRLYGDDTGELDARLAETARLVAPPDAVPIKIPDWPGLIAERDAARATIAEQAAEDALTAMDPDDWANDGKVARAVVTALGRADLLAEPGELTALRATIKRLRTAGQYLADVLRAGGTGTHTASGLGALARWEAALDAAPTAETESGSGEA